MTQVVAENIVTDERERQFEFKAGRRGRTVRTGVVEWLLLLALTAGSVAIHGYHGGVEDAEIYLPGVLKQLNPALFPWNTRFFDSHAGMTLFPGMIAESIRLSHLAPEV